MKRLATFALALMASCTNHQATLTPPSTGPLASDDQKSLYALGYLLGANLKPFSLTPSELEVVTEGTTDSVNGVQARVDLSAYHTKVQAMAMSRGKALAEAQKQKDAPLLAKAAAEPGAEKLASGIIVQQLGPGAGDSPTGSDMVKVDYEGRLLSDGTIFDSSAQRGQPASLSLRSVFKCWSEGLQKLKVGEKAKLTCPSETAYGDMGHPPKIPGGAALTFEVTLREISKGPSTPQVASAASKPGAVNPTPNLSPKAGPKPQQVSAASGAHGASGVHGHAAPAAPKG